MDKKTRTLVSARAILAALSILFAFFSVHADQKDIHLDVYKTPTCGCCVDWIKHVEEHNFQTTVYHPENINALKQEKGIKRRFQSCHTGVSERGYVFEGHIPARFINEFLASPPNNSIGLSVPGMPVGSPGMEVDDKFLPYKILTLMKDGSVEVFKEIKNMNEQYDPSS